jgi:hypothetical protein
MYKRIGGDTVEQITDKTVGQRAYDGYLCGEVHPTLGLVHDGSLLFCSLVDTL